MTGTSRRQARTAAVRALGALGLGLWVAIPVLVIASVRDRAERVRLIGREPTVVEVLPNTGEVVTAAGLRLSWAIHAPAVAPAWTGIVTRASIAVGDPAVDGRVVASVDGIDRILAATGQPFSRTLAPGDRGPDVRALNDLLRRRGLDAGSDDRFSAATTRGVVAFSGSIGAAPSFEFDPAWVVYLAHDGARVATVGLTVGAPAPAAGTAVLTMAPDLVSAAVIPRQDAPPEQPTGSGTGASDAESGATPGTSSSPGAPDDPFASIEAVVVPEGTALRVDGQELALDEARSGVAARSLPSLASAVALRAPYADASLAAPADDDQRVVPAAAVVTDQDGTACVLEVVGDATRAEAVLLVGGDGGQSIVVPADPGRLRPGVRIRVGAPAGERSCR